ncbi:MAG: DUF5985 family protein [Candidatus Acidiferrales bacterium]
MIEAFALGAIALASLIAAVFFLRFWRDARDLVFLAFAAFFLIEAVERTLLIFLPHPNEGSPAFYVVRLMALLFILTAILRKNLGRG